jgi:hypothetical protein
LVQLYFDATRGHLPVYRKWLMGVYQTRQASEQEAARLAETSVA